MEVYMHTNGKIALAAGGLALTAAGGIAAWIIMGNIEYSAPAAEIYQNGELLRTLPLSEDTEFTVDYENGYNVITVRNGKICVSKADCPDKICVNMGEISGGTPIVCLPHRLEIRVVNGNSNTDADI